MCLPHDFPKAPLFAIARLVVSFALFLIHTNEWLAIVRVVGRNNA